MNTEATLCQSHSFLLQLFPECRSGDARRPSMVAAKDSGIFNLEGEMWDTRLGKAAAGGWILSSLAETKAPAKSRSLVKLALWIAIAMIVAITFLGGCAESVWATPIYTNASYYTYASCLREGTSGITASGEKLHDEGEYTFAHPTAAFGERLRIKFGNREIVARCNDRGPNTKCLKRGTGIDLNLSAFKALVGEDVSCGLVKVSIERIK